MKGLISLGFNTFTVHKKAFIYHEEKISYGLFFCPFQNFAAQMAGGFDEKSGGAQMGVMQGPMVSER